MRMSVQNDCLVLLLRATVCSFVFLSVVTLGGCGWGPPASCGLWQPGPPLGELLAHTPQGPSPFASGAILMQNTTFVPLTNRDVVWDQVVDVVDDYFRIERERRVRLVGNVLTEGRIDTFPQGGATVLEPHMKDSVGRMNRWESTFQAIRRQATVRVIPAQGGFLVEVQVDKQLEDLPQPDRATAGAATFRHDTSLHSGRMARASNFETPRMWIDKGRDPALEQRILADIQERLGGLASHANW